MPVKQQQQQSKPSANDKQIGGVHYKRMGIEPWDFIAINELGYFEGTAIAYIARAGLKGGDQGRRDDLKKAIHFLEKRLECLDVETERKR